MLPLTPQSRCLVLFISIQLARKELNLRPASYKDAALTAELRASSWVGGIRTHTSLIKSQVCSRYTTTQKGSGVSVCIARLSTSHYSIWFVNCFASQSGSPENRTQRDGLIRAIRTTSPRLPSGCRPSTVSVCQRLASALVLLTADSA